MAPRKSRALELEQRFQGDLEMDPLETLNGFSDEELLTILSVSTGYSYKSFP
jgi:hypothetical protein